MTNARANIDTSKSEMPKSAVQIEKLILDTVDKLKAEVATLQEQVKVLREALEEFVGAAQSWHDFHKHTEGIQCDRLCACIAPAHAALNSGERPTQGEFVKTRKTKPLTPAERNMYGCQG